MTRVCIDIDPDNGTGTPGPTVKAYETTIGDGSQVDFSIDHNLGDRTPFLQVYDLATGLLRADADVTWNGDNRATVRFDQAPGNQSVRVRALSVKPPATSGQ
jgi:hypothetical protein